MHMSVPGVWGYVERNCARLIGQSKHPLDGVRHNFPLRSVEAVSVGVANRNMKKRRQTLGCRGHNVNAPKR